MIEKLASLGCDTKGALARLDGDTGLYESLVMDILRSSLLSDLRLAVSNGDRAAVVEYSRDVWGVLANLGLIPMETHVKAILDTVNGSNAGDIPGSLACLESEINKFREILNI